MRPWPLSWQAAVDQREEELEGEIIIIDIPADITHYEVRYSVGGGAFGAWVQHAAPSTSLTVANLVNGIEHTFHLRAVNSAGAGPWAEVTATPLGAGGTGGAGGAGSAGGAVVEEPQNPDFEPDFGGRRGPTLVYRVGTPVETSLPFPLAATSFRVQPELPDGLSFNTLERHHHGHPHHGAAANALHVDGL